MTSRKQTFFKHKNSPALIKIKFEIIKTEILEVLQLTYCDFHLHIQTNIYFIKFLCKGKCLLVFIYQIKFVKSGEAYMVVYIIISLLTTHLPFLY